MTDLPGEKCYKCKATGRITEEDEQGKHIVQCKNCEGNGWVPWKTTVSQTNNYKGCNRKWALASELYLTRLPKKSTAKGDRFHAVVERYLDVDENHLKDGKEPELYPEGWHIQKDYFGNKVLFVLTKSEQEVIKKAVQRGIDQSILVRQPNAVVEHKIEADICEGLMFHGLIDYAYDWTIEDHKSCKNFRYTLVDKKGHARYIGKDTQLKIYAYHWAKKRESEGHEIPKYLTIRHNQFCLDENEFDYLKDPVRKVETKVLFSDCEKEWKELIESGLEQLEIRKKFQNEENYKFTKVPKDINWCDKYGGCDFLNVCRGQQSIDNYNKIQENKIELLTLQLKQQSKETRMNFDIAGGGATSAQSKVLEEAEGVKEVETKEEPKAEEIRKLRSTLMAKELEKGIKDAKAEIKKITETLKSIDQPQAMIDEATKVFTKRLESLETEKKELIEKEAEAAKKAKEAEEKKKAEEKAKKAKAATEKKAKAEAAKKAKEEEEAAKKEAETKTVEEEVKVEEAEQEEQEEEPPKEDDEFAIVAEIKSRNQQVTLLINCVQVSGRFSNTITIERLLQIKGAQMAKKNNATSFYELDTWQRRQAWDHSSAFLYKELSKGGFTIIATNPDPDELALIKALKKIDKIIVFQGTSS